LLVTLACIHSVCRHIYTHAYIHMSGAVVATTGFVRVFADGYVMPFLVRSRGHEVSPDGYFMFPSWEAIVFEAVSGIHMSICVFWDVTIHVFI
jgi:hypothetical protein